ncbi:Metallo-dependent phosphatase-like protein [Hysterangium stoloniferum]|nr:Metallo-dependent phosphatase-like protein [Hysterangium stoloniferum]
MASLQDFVRVIASSGSKSRFITYLRLFWIGIILWCELGTFHFSLVSCNWPDTVSLLQNASLSSTHILLIADPQVLDHNSYPGRPAWLQTVTQYVVDLNLRKSWNAISSRFHPQMAIFLGDMMDNGRSIVDEREYNAYVTRFKTMFKFPKSTPSYFLPGNHDIGLGPSANLTMKSLAYQRFKTHFGALNQNFKVGNYTTFLLIDAPGLVDEFSYAQSNFHDWREVTGGSIEYLLSFIEQRPPGPVILFTHIPLHRTNIELGKCGSLREKSDTIHPGRGAGYENLLPHPISAFILDKLRPSIVFSGDDHDYCDYTHTMSNGRSVREVTVPSISMAMGVRRPGFQLLAVATPQSISEGHNGDNILSAGLITDTLCHLPDQIGIYIYRYAAFGILTVLAILVINYRHDRAPCGSRRSINKRGRSSSRRSFSLSSEFGLANRQDFYTIATDEHRASPTISTRISHNKTVSSASLDSDTNTPDASLPLYIPSERNDVGHEKSRHKRGFISIVFPTSKMRRPKARSGAWLFRSARDFWKVAWPSLFVYVGISCLFWR